MPSLLTIAEARAAGLGKGLSDADLQARIDGTEATLARRIGPLTGLRTTSYRAGRAIWLSRPWKTDPAPVVSDDGTPLIAGTDYVIWPGGRVRLTDSYGWIGQTRTVEWEPDDEAAVKEALLALLDLHLSPFQSEKIGDYNYSRGSQTPAQVRDGIYASLVFGSGTGL